jgi:hypothetical protein
MRLTSKILKKYKSVSDKLDEASHTQASTLKTELNYLISKHRVIKLIKESVFPVNEKVVTEGSRSINESKVLLD